MLVDMKAGDNAGFLWLIQILSAAQPRIYSSET